MLKQEKVSTPDAQETTAVLPSGAVSTKRKLSIPKKGKYLVINSHRGVYLCLLLFKQSKKEDKSDRPHTYVVKPWETDRGFFTKTIRFQIENSQAKEFDDFKEAGIFYKGLL